MSTDLQDLIHERIRTLPIEQQKEVLRFVDALSQRARPEESSDLTKWLHEARRFRAQLPETSDSVEILRQLRQERSRQ